MWLKKGLTAIYAPVFLQIKERLKEILKDNVIYSDGKTLKDLNKQLEGKVVEGNVQMLENDFSKFDR